MTHTPGPWEELVKTESGTILHDEYDEGLRFIVMRGPCSLCAYVGLPSAHPLAGHNYDDLPVSAHGGLTFAAEGHDAWPEGFYWYGWDYGHSGDSAFYYSDPKLTHIFEGRHQDEKKWLVKDVVADSWGALYDFKHLMHLAEAIAKGE